MSSYWPKKIVGRNYRQILCLILLYAPLHNVILNVSYTIIILSRGHHFRIKNALTIRKSALLPSTILR